MKAGQYRLSSMQEPPEERDWRRGGAYRTTRQDGGRLIYRQKRSLVAALLRNMPTADVVSFRSLTRRMGRPFYHGLR